MADTEHVPIIQAMDLLLSSYDVKPRFMLVPEDIFLAYKNYLHELNGIPERKMPDGRYGIYCFRGVPIICDCTTISSPRPSEHTSSEPS